MNKQEKTIKEQFAKIGYNDVIYEIDDKTFQPTITFGGKYKIAFELIKDMKNLHGVTLEELVNDIVMGSDSVKI